MSRRLAPAALSLLSALCAAVLLAGPSLTDARAQTPAATAPQVTRSAGNTPSSVVRYWLDPAPTSGGVVERGGWLYRQKGCFLCHGPEGQGGVPNRNYIKDTIPRLALAADMRLDPEDVPALVQAMTRGVRPDAMVDTPPVPEFNVVLAQYHSIRDVIRNGNPAGRKNPKGPAPPLNMPAWGRELSDSDIDAIIAYLLTAVPANPPR